MKAFRSALLPFYFAAALCTRESGRAADPVLDQPIPINPPEGAAEKTTVPIGKALVVPITALDADGDRLTYSVKSDRTNVRVRVRTGNPKLKIQVNHAGDGSAADPAFTGFLEFSLFRDLTPITASFIGGFAQSGYYDNQVFHRIADLNPLEDSDGSFIIQGGDPHGSDPAQAGKGGPGFTFDNEFHPGLILSGKGQLAMANSGINPLTYKGTNGSQFFITAGHPRFLDFNHTIFGQLLRGWDVLDKLEAVPRFPNVANPPASEPPDRPKVDVRLTSATLEPNFQDAILIVSATGLGDATITVTATDTSGGKDTKTFTVSPVPDDTNDPPFVMPVGPKTAPLGQIFEIPLKIIDLEHDYSFASNRALSGSVGQAGGSNPALTLSTTVGPVIVGTSVTQYDMTFRNPTLDISRSTDDQIAIAIAGGDKPIDAKIVSISGTPAAALTNVTVAAFTDSDGTAQPSEYTAKVNWGDGSTPTTGTIVRDPSSAATTAFIVRDTHLYARAGTYPLVVTLTATKGQSAVLRGEAVITNYPIKPFGRTLTTKGARLLNSIVATFKDETPAAATAYTATISWGDGTHGTGTVRLGPFGEFQVLATHVFPDPQDYLVSVRIHKNGADAATDPYAWSRVEARGFVKAAHIPPFAAANLIGQFGQHGSSPLRKTSGNTTLGAGELVVINAGNRSVRSAKVRFYLSKDAILNVTEDLPLLIGPSKMASMNLGAFKAGAGRRFIFDYTPAQPGLKTPPGGENFGLPVSTGTAASDTRLRFPADEDGAGLNVIAHLTYNDPLTKNLPIDYDIVFGPFESITVSPTVLTVREADANTGSAKFKVKLLRQPTADVTIAVSVPATSPQVTIDKTSLIFTSENWSTEQEVTVTAIDDNTTDGEKSVTVTLSAAQSTDITYNKIDPADVKVAVKDKAAN